MIVAPKAKPSGVMRPPFLFSPARASRKQHSIRGHFFDTIGLWSDAVIPIVMLSDRCSRIATQFIVVVDILKAQRQSRTPADQGRNPMLDQFLVMRDHLRT